MDIANTALSNDMTNDALRRGAFDLDPAQAPIRQDRAVSWRAVLAGAAGAAALSLILLILGTGLGLSSVSPWVDHGATASSLGYSTIAWITLTQLAASALGGYLAGRLRGRWPDALPDEVYFRDTAHGFLAWAVATLATAALLTSAMAAILGTTAQTGATLLAGAEARESNAYYVNSLFRPDPARALGASGAAPASPVANRPNAASNAEAIGIVVNGLKLGALPPADAAYLGRLVSEQTGMGQQDAHQRVTEVFARMQSQAREAETTAREAADKARKASAYAALWLFVSLLLGAFGASLAATFGGRQRDLP